jgi:hypothetical protein
MKHGSTLNGEATHGTAGDSEPCPICGFHYTRIVSVSVQEAEGPHVARLYGAGAGDLERGHRAGQVDVRGKVFSLHFTCENGHDYARVFSSHKGWTLTRTIEEPPFPLLQSAGLEGTQ